MTTVAYRDGVVACDTGVTNSGVFVGACAKAGRIGDLLWGTCGNTAPCKAFRDWLVSGAPGECPAFPPGAKAEGFVVVDGRIVTFYDIGPDVITADFYAIGSGATIALGAMAHGASAERAVEIACQLDTSSRAPVLRFAL